jgi:hypothetical protein
MKKSTILFEETTLASKPGVTLDDEESMVKKRMLLE